ncbi:MAG: hypothetical protein RL687_502 [Candidatus Parcubacteria bacterium]|jgi:sensor domain CHASE-containing protein
MDIKQSSSIRFKIIAIILLCILALSLVIYFYSTSIFQRSYEQIEQDESRRNVQLVENQMSNIMDQLELKIIDWAWWDDTYQFVKDKNKDYIISNLGVGSVSNLKINSIVYIDKENSIIFSKNVDFNAKEELKSFAVDEHISSHPKLSEFSNEKIPNSGIIMLPEGPMIVATAPVLDSDANGQSRGTLFFGKYLDSSMVSFLSKLTYLNSNIYRYDDLFLPDDVAFAKNNFTKDKKIVTRPISIDYIAGYTILPDFYGDPALILKVETPRSSFNEGKDNLNSFVLISIVSVLLFGIFIYLFIEMFFIYRFSRLSNEVYDISQNKDFNKRVTESRKDGIGSVAVAINEMLKIITSVLKKEEESRDKMIDSEKKLKDKVQELEKINQLMVGRELQMLELKKEINNIKK